MSNRIDGAEFKKNYEKATDEKLTNELILNYGEHHDLTKKKSRNKITQLGNYIKFRTNFIKHQMKIIVKLTNDNKKLKDIYERQRERLRRNNTQSSMNTNNMGGSSSSKIKPKKRFLRSASMEVNPPLSRQNSLSSIDEKPMAQKLKEQYLEREREYQRQRERQRELERQEERELKLKRDIYRHLLGSEKKIPENLKNLEGWDDEWNREKHLEQQKNMYERFERQRGSSSTTTAPKRSNNNSEIDYSNIIFGDQPRKRTQTQANSGSSGFSNSTPAKKKCTETYKVGDIVDVTAYGENNYRATITAVGPNIVMMGNQNIEIEAGKYLVTFDTGQWEVMGAKWTREGWYISKLIARKSEEKPFEGLDLNKMDIKF